MDIITIKIHNLNAFEWRKRKKKRQINVLNRWKYVGCVWAPMNRCESTLYEYNGNGKQVRWVEEFMPFPSLNPHNEPFYSTFAELFPASTSNEGWTWMRKNIIIRAVVRIIGLATTLPLFVGFQLHLLCKSSSNNFVFHSIV